MRDARYFPILCLLLSSAVLSLSACGDGGTNTTSQGGSAGATNTGGSTAGSAGSSAGSSGASGSGGSSAGSAGSMTTASGGSGPMTVADCQGHIYECGDLIDNDGDGLVDAEDPDCLGPCDNTEGSFYGGIPGQSGPSCTVDCYFDQDSGSGNDDCHWSHECDPNEEMAPGHPEPSSKCKYNPNANVSGTSSTCDQLKMMQSDTCTKVCGPLTPNGCDCFGCCELPAGSGKFVWLGSEDEATGQGSCSLDVLDDPTKCEPCIVVPSCFNDCGKCELCIGKKPEDIPPECNPGTGGAGGTSVGSGGSSGTGGAGGSGTQCDAGIQPCGLPGQPACPSGYYCVTGCCQLIDIPK